VAILAVCVACSGGSPAPTAAATTAPATRITATPAATANPASVRADELGRIPVLMYHQLVASPKGAYDQTRAEFRAEIDRLYASGYRTITAADLVAGRIDVPAGKSPMVLTFDDATVSQYGELPDGRVDPRSAVGMLLEVAHRWGEARPVATFYVNEAPFAGRPRYLASLAKLGMEIGVHTESHVNLRGLSAPGVQRELARGFGLIRAAVPGARVTTMSLPFGAFPRDPALVRGGAGYAFEGVFRVGSGPARSPYSKGFDAFGVPRIRSGMKTGDQAFTSTYWLPRLQATRFVSDGDPSVISFPRAKASLLDPRFRSRARPY
jgi:hypothetical protein